MNSARTQKLNRHIAGDHFQKLGDLLEHPELNEQCGLMLHHQKSVFAAKGAKRVYLV